MTAGGIDRAALAALPSTVRREVHANPAVQRWQGHARYTSTAKKEMVRLGLSSPSPDAHSPLPPAAVVPGGAAGRAGAAAEEEGIEVSSGEEEDKPRPEAAAAAAPLSGRWMGRAGSLVRPRLVLGSSVPAPEVVAAAPAPAPAHFYSDEEDEEEDFGAAFDLNRFQRPGPPPATTAAAATAAHLPAAAAAPPPPAGMAGQPLAGNDDDDDEEEEEEEYLPNFDLVALYRQQLQREVSGPATGSAPGPTAIVAGGQRQQEGPAAASPRAVAAAAADVAWEEEEEEDDDYPRPNFDLLAAMAAPAPQGARTDQLFDFVNRQPPAEAATAAPIYHPEPPVAAPQELNRFARPTHHPDLLRPMPPAPGLWQPAPSSHHLPAAAAAAAAAAPVCFASCSFMPVEWLGPALIAVFRCRCRSPTRARRSF